MTAASPSQWFRTAKNQDVSTVSFARPFARLFTPLTKSLSSQSLLHLRAPAHSFVRSFTLSRTRERVNGKMFQIDLVLSHSASAEPRP